MARMFSAERRRLGVLPLLIGAALAVGAPAIAQSGGGFVSGQPLTASALNTAFSLKQNLLTGGDCTVNTIGKITCGTLSGVSPGYFFSGTSAANLTGTLNAAQLPATAVQTNVASTFTAKQTFMAAGSGGAGINCGQGAAPASPVNGDFWCTSSGAFTYLGGTTYQLGGSSFGVATFNGRAGTVTLQSSDVTTALGYTPLSTAGGTITGGLTVEGGFTGALNGNASTASAWANSRTISLTGPVTGSVSVNGSTNANLPTTIANSGVTAGTYGGTGGGAYPVLTVGSDGRVTAIYTQDVGYPSQFPNQAGISGADLSTTGSNVIWSYRARATFQAFSGGFAMLGSTNATITRLSLGCYSMTFPYTAMNNANYTFTGTAGPYNSSGHVGDILNENDNVYSRTTTGVGFCIYNVNTNPDESNQIVNVSVQAN